MYLELSMLVIKHASDISVYRNIPYFGSRSHFGSSFARFQVFTISIVYREDIFFTWAVGYIYTTAPVYAALGISIYYAPLHLSRYSSDELTLTPFSRRKRDFLSRVFIDLSLSKAAASENAGRPTRRRRSSSEAKLFQRENDFRLGRRRRG